MGVELPASVLKLTEPYEMRVYWFEIVECIRKLALTGMPVWFEMGSTAQLTFGLLISFSSFGAYMLLAPYAKEQDDKLAQLCQAQTFFALVSSIILQSAPPESTTNRNMGVLLVILTALPIAVGIAMEFTSGQSEDKRKKLAYKVINKVVRTSRYLVQELDRDPTPEEIAEKMEMPVERVRKILKIAKEPISLETPIGEEDDSHLGDFIEDKNAILPVDAAIHSNLKETTTRVLASLTAREERVLRMRFGIGMNTDHTLEEVGQQFSVTRERIRQIEAKALRKLKHPSRSRKLRSFLDN